MLKSQTACDYCHLQYNNYLSQGGAPLAEGVCFTNRPAGPGGCRFPFPELRPLNRSVWDLYHLAYGASNNAGMDGVPIGKHPADVKALAEGMDIPWTQETISKLTLIETAYLKDFYEEKARKDAQRK